MTSPSKRREVDLMRLMMGDYEVQMQNDCMNEFSVKFKGPKDSPYEGGTWRVQVEIPPGYPHKSPSIGFSNRIFHPNVDFSSGSVCLDVINQTWSPMFDLVNIFESFLPQLLLYPNAADPLNSEAASLLLKEPERYKMRVKECVQKYAAHSDPDANDAMSEDESSSSSEMSDYDDNDDEFED
eukprot:TRINITY_DN9494_c0_g1_i1.p1 TRINITY_DN9494_c0_g1~~TRINITY_DN9494_c0_g1_i1.p1  ORF type:complete len:182 (-),score=42.33 TRINITY_DN9494_c0_g1_i1:195-740(-)